MRAGEVILSGGAINSPQLLLLSGDLIMIANMIVDMMMMILLSVVQWQLVSSLIQIMQFLDKKNDGNGISLNGQ